MNRLVSKAAALAVTLAIGGVANPAAAQSGMMTALGYSATPSAMPLSRTTGRASSGTIRRVQHQSVAQKSSPSPTPAPQHEDLPSPTMGPMDGQGGEYFGEGYVGEGYIDEGYGGGYGGDGCCGDDFGYYGGYGCGDCGDDCCSDGCWGCSGNGSWWDFCDCCDLFGSHGVDKRWYFTADYLYVRANFSQAVAYLIHDDSDAPNFVDQFHQLNFQHDSSYRFGAGYRLGCCDEEVRFLFTRMNSYADDEAPEGAVVPYEISVPPGGQTLIHADVDTKSWDLEYAKTIPLGGTCGGCECGDTCGCGGGYCSDPCGGGSCGPCCSSCGCPAWDITWSGGIRFADVDWARSYRSFNVDADPERDARVRMNFEGGGPRFGLTGRRYFGECGWFSVFLKGDISLLLGKLNLEANRLVFGQTSDVPPNDFTQTINCRHIIPVTEIEAGLTAQITCSSTLSAGYLFSAWHDLGFRDEFNFANITFLETGYDDANILGFDGLFVRYEWTY
jgi:Legionella pneumophila major outer membrane protein precursor